MMRPWRCALCAALLCGLGLGLGLTVALDSNTIRSSREQQPDRSHGYQVEQDTRRRPETDSNGRPRHGCRTADCDVAQRTACSNRAQKRPSAQDRHRDRERDGHRDINSFNRTKAPEMSPCVRSRDCADGLCCARYLSRKLCLRVPEQGDACQLRGAVKGDKKLGRCACAVGLTCSAVSRSESRRSKGQGVCLRRPRPQQRKKRRRTAESSC